MTIFYSEESKISNRCLTKIQFYQWYHYFLKSVNRVEIMLAFAIIDLSVSRGSGI